MATKDTIVCNKCGKEKKSSDFYISNSDINSHNKKATNCKACMGEVYGNYYIKFRDIKLAIYHFCRKYDICFNQATFNAVLSEIASGKKTSPYQIYMTKLNSLGGTNGAGNIYFKSQALSTTEWTELEYYVSTTAREEVSVTKNGVKKVITPAVQAFPTGAVKFKPMFIINYKTGNGVALVDNQEYRFKSVTKSEKEGKEIEEEYSFTLYKDNDSYIKIVQEYEEERDEVEKYYRYQVVENGVKVYDYLLDYEKETGHKNETEIKLTLDNRKYKIEEIQKKDGNYLQVQVIETNSLESRSTYKVLFKKVISESGVSYELVG